jgi:dihydrofolate reductase
MWTKVISFSFFSAPGGKMKKVILYIASSLDGFIARNDGDISWLYCDQDYGYKAFLKTIDAVVMGRKTYEQVLTFGEYPYKGMLGYVVTSRKKLEGPAKQVRLYNGSLSVLVDEIKQKNKKDIWLIGGGQLVSGFLNAGLIDEIVLSIHPIILGKGIPLFPDIRHERSLKLLDSKKFTTGLLQIKYKSR